MQDVSLRIKDLVAKAIPVDDQRNLTKVYELRHKIFVEKLGWVTGENGLEKDSFDNTAVIFGVFQGEKLLGTIRIIPPPGPFMIDNVFEGLLDKDKAINRPASLEISRLAVDPDVDRKSRVRITLLLYRLIDIWARMNRIRYLYLVSTDGLIRSLARRYKLPIAPFTMSATTSDGSVYRAGVIDLNEIGLIRRTALQLYSELI